VLEHDQAAGALAGLAAATERPVELAGPGRPVEDDMVAAMPRRPSGGASKVQ
jgi:hypothetical protein